jgi:hypothetical protein
VNAVAASSLNLEMHKEIETLCADTVKRYVYHNTQTWIDDAGLYRILEFQEMKTTWHPIDKAIGSTAKY